MKRRTGMTLVEVLVAIFVMGIGLIALLSLFPIGILRIAQAIHDSKCATCSINATTLARVNGFANDSLVVSDTVFPDATGSSPDLFVRPLPALPAAHPNGPSYPILVDPIGFFGGGINQWVGGVNGVLRRRPVSLITTAANGQLAMTQNFKLWDDMPFQNGDPFAGDTPGAPSAIAGTLLRDPRYSWGYVFRRPQTADRSVVECSVLVFDSRPLISLAEYPYLLGVTVPPNTGPTPTYYDPGNNIIYIQYDVVAPPIRPGSWIMDVTQFQPGGATTFAQFNAASNPAWASGNAYFYRVVAADELPGKLMRYEVQQPIRGMTNPTGVFPTNSLFPTSTLTVGAGSVTVIAGSSIVFEGLAQVFDKGLIRLP